MLASVSFLMASTFLASAVEAVEATTVVLAMGVTRGWRAPLLATLAALLALAALVAAFGPALVRVPIDALRLVVGALLLVFGMGWLRKAILRASGRKALRDEDAAYARQVDSAREQPVAAGFDAYGFTLVFKAVFLEGLEVAFIVLSFGAPAHAIGSAAVAAGAAVVGVGALGATLHAPLSRVPENTMKFGVGLMLTTFGLFWSVEGAGARWPGDDLAILGVLGALTMTSLALVAVLRRA